VAECPVELAERLRAKVCAQMDDIARAKMGQFLTPPPVATILAGMFGPFPERIKLLDAGCGVGSLTAAFVKAAIRRPDRPKAIHMIAVEVEPQFLSHLEEVLQACVAFAGEHGVAATFEICTLDFLRLSVDQLQFGFEGKRPNLQGITHCILNPPYAKINTDSEARRLVRDAGLETSNLYTGFLWVAACLLAAGGELVAITPRSWCNGPYFLPFREKFLKLMALDRIHTFDRRDVLFADDNVLQENIVFRVRRTPHPGTVLISSTNDIGQLGAQSEVPYSDVVHAGDPQQFVHVISDENGHKVKDMAREGGVTLRELGLKVSTGRVVDFRATAWLRKDPEPGAVPLIYPQHLAKGWPIQDFKKFNAFQVTPEGNDQLVPNGVYVLTKRFTSKEEKRRVVAFLYKPIAGYDRVGFENHLNYFHTAGEPLDATVAKGLAAFLNSQFVDTYFRQFSGHTQVNATDLRSLRYPTLDQLMELAGVRDVEAALGQMLKGQAHQVP
jgi:adenine-specific DNA-methyltransferase